MNWRPWVITAAVFGGIIFNVGLLVTEHIDVEEGKIGPEVVKRDHLLNNRITVSDRRTNFKAYGLDNDMVESAASKASKIYKSRKKQFHELMRGPAAESASQALCKGDELPVRYRAMSVLVGIDGKARRTIAVNEIVDFEPQPWFGSNVEDVYRAVEQIQSRKPDATAMGIGAILAGKEQIAIGGEAPWGQGGLSSWSQSRMYSDYSSLKLRRRLTDYFALMHVMAEIAHAEDGICK